MSNLSQLADKIKNHFSIHELNQVVHDLGVDTEEFNGTISSRAIGVVQYFLRRSILPDLVKALAERKPTVDFSYWGAPLPTESLSGVLRQLLDVGFASDGIRTISFDIFPDLHDDVVSARSKTMAIELVVNSAIKEGKVLPLMDHIRNCNPHQYGAYFARVDKALTEHKNKEVTHVPYVEPSQKARLGQKADQITSSTLLALQMYADGLQDGGVLAKKALEMQNA